MFPSFPRTSQNSPHTWQQQAVFSLITSDPAIAPFALLYPGPPGRVTVTEEVEVDIVPGIIMAGAAAGCGIAMAVGAACIMGAACTTGAACAMGVA